MKISLTAFTIPIVIFVGAVIMMRDEVNEPVSVVSEREEVKAILADITFNTPKRVNVLLNEQFLDKKSRIRYNTYVFKTDEAYLPKSPKNPDTAANALEILQTALPEYDFGEPMNDEASYSRLLIGNAEWTISSLHTTYGHFSKWVKQVDAYQLLSEDI